MKFLWILAVGVLLNTSTFAQFNFSNLDLNGHELKNPTDLKFGPDGRLYVCQQDGLLKVFTVQRLEANSYQVVTVEQITLIQQIPNYNDDGSLHDPSIQMRQVTGILVTGTEEAPVLYVGSSDYRIGGPSEGDTNLDTNSGIVSRLTWKGADPPSATNFTQLANEDLWEKVDLIRGLPRSEENHANNHMDIATVNGKPYLFICSGGNTNGGGPSQNFTKITEFALSSAILSVDLVAIDALPSQTDEHGQVYKYDIPTVDDPTRPNKNGIEDPNAPGYDGVDVGDPWGGNDGLNQGRLVVGGPIQVFSPGYRNTYGLVITEAGRMYVTDNGANPSWGGLPKNVGPPVEQDGKLVSLVTNDYHLNNKGNEAGGNQNNPYSSDFYNNIFVNNEDNLHLVTGIGDPSEKNIYNYQWGSYYGGHPTPIRANPEGAGLYTLEHTKPLSSTGTFRTVKYDPNGEGDAADPGKALPADWPPVPMELANPIEGEFRNPSTGNGPGEDGAILLWARNTNPVAEYTASNLDGAYKGNLIAGSSNGGGKLFLVKLKPDGTNDGLNQNFASFGGGSYVLGVYCHGDDEIFPGTIWACQYGNGVIRVLEPSDYDGGDGHVITCIDQEDPEFDPEADYDNDGYTNHDEILNGSDYCNPASRPLDTNGNGISDYLDTDDDADGIPDVVDVFQLDPENGLGSPIPVALDLFNNKTGFYDLGFTGLMANLDPEDDYLYWLEPTYWRGDADGVAGEIYGGATGTITMYMDEGDAYGTQNNQRKGFQFGVDVHKETPQFKVESRLLKPFHTPVAGESYGIFIGNGDQDNYVKLVRAKDGFEVVVESDGVPQKEFYPVDIPEGSEETDGMDILELYFVVDPNEGTVHPAYSIDEGTVHYLGDPFTVDGKILEVLESEEKAMAVGAIGTTGGEEKYTVSYTTFRVEYSLPEDKDLFTVRINAGQLTGDNYMDHNGVNWENDKYYVSGRAYPPVPSGVYNQLQSVEFDNTERHALYRSERIGVDGWEYAIPVENGKYAVRLHFAELYWQVISDDGGAGSRIFDVLIEGDKVLNNYDVFSEVGRAAAIEELFEANVEDGFLNIKGVPVVDQAKISAIEVFGMDGRIFTRAVPNQRHYEGDEVDLLVKALGGGGGNLTFTATGLPPGLELEPTNGHLSGKIADGASETNGGIYEVEITITAGEETAKTAFTWEVFGDIPNLWTMITPEGDDHIARHESSFAQIGDKFYLFSGRETAKVEIYDPATNTWSEGAEAPLEISHFQAVAYQGLIWAIGGFKDHDFPTEQPADYMYIYDPVADEWTEGPEMPADRKRGATGLVVYNDKFYLSGGIQNGHTDGWVAWFDEYDPATNTWTQLPDAPQARDHCHAVVIGNKMYLTTGRRTGEVSTFVPLISEVDVYDFEEERWLSPEETPDNIPTPRSGAGIVNFQGEIVVIGGEGTQAGPAINKVEALDVATGTWRELANLTHGRHGIQAIASGPGIFVTSGSPTRGGGNMTNMEVYGINEPSQGSLVTASNLAVPDMAGFGGSTEPKSIAVASKSGSQALYIHSITIEGDDADDFEITGGSLQEGVFVFPGANKTIAVKVNTNDGTAKKANLVITYGAGKTATIPLDSEAEDLTLAVDAGEDKILPSSVSSIELEAVVSGVIDAEITYEWIQKSGPALADLEGDNTAKLTVSGLIIGEYVFAINVTSSTGATATDEVKVTIQMNGLNKPQNVSASSGLYEDKILVVWDDVSVATHYRVYRATEDNPETASPISDWTTASNFEDTDVEEGQVYYYFVKAAMSAEGEDESDFSDGDTGFLKAAGAGDNPAISLNFTTLNFGNIGVGQDSTLSVTISSSGGADLEVSSIDLPEGFTASWESGTIEMGESVKVGITFSPTEEKSYNGTITINSNAAVGTGSIEVTALGGDGVPTGIGKHDISKSVTIYPNPVQDEFNIRLENDLRGFVKMRVMNTVGQQINSYELNKDAYTIEQKIDSAQLPKGLYLIEVNIGQYRAVKRINKQ